MSSFSYKPFASTTTVISGAVVSNTTIVSPLSSYNELNISQMSPAAQGDFVYGINSGMFNSLGYSGGSVSASGGFAIPNSGVGITGSGDVAFRRSLKYRPGQGALGRMSVLFDTPKDNNVQLAGVGNAECGYYFGYYGTNFGIFHIETSQREVRKLTLTTGATTGLVNITLDGTTVSVPVTGGSNVNQTSYQLSRYDYSQVGSGWLAESIDGTVCFISSRPGIYTGSYGVSGASITGTFSSLLLGDTGSVVFTPQANFNIDKIDGTGASGATIAPLSGNVYQIGFQYGFGPAFFAILNPLTGRILPVHVESHVGQRLTPTLKNPQLTARLVSANIGNNTNVAPKAASMSLFTEGPVLKLDPRFSYSTTYSINSSTYLGIMAIKPTRIFNGKTSYAEIDIVRIAASNESTSKTLTIAVFKNPFISGIVNFQYIDQVNSVVAYADFGTTGSAITYTGQPSFLYQVGPQTGQTIDINTEELITSPGDILVFAIKSTGQCDGAIGVNWFEQQ